MPSTKALAYRSCALLLRALSLFFLLAGFRHVAHADPVSAITAGIGVVGSLAGGLIGSSAAKKAAGQQAQAGYQAEQLYGNAGQVAQNGVAAATASGQQGIAALTATGQQTVTAGQQEANTQLGNVFGLQTGNLAPYLQAGGQGVSQLLAATSPGGSLATQFAAPTADQARSTPGYQFALDQGLQALQRSAAAGGFLQGGGTGKAITQYAQNYADTNYQNVYNNALGVYNTNRTANLQNISTLLNTGQFGTSQYNQAATNYGNLSAGNIVNASQLAAGYGIQGASQIANLGLQGSSYIGNNAMQTAQGEAGAITNAANAQAAGTVGSANAWQGALGGVTNSAQYYGMTQALGNAGNIAPNGFQYYNNAPQANLNPYQPTGGAFATPYGNLTPPPVNYNAQQYTLPTVLNGNPSAPQMAGSSPWVPANLAGL